MNRFDGLFDSPRRHALIPFLMLGDPDLETSLKIILAVVEGGDQGTVAPPVGRVGLAQSRRRYDLYKAASLTSKVTTTERLKELKAESEVAQMRLLRARASA